MLTALLCFVFAMIIFCPDTDLGRALRRALVEWPARQIARLTRRRVALGLAGLVVLVGALAVAHMVEDGMMVVQVLPEGLAWFAAFDGATYLEIIAAVWLVAGTVRLRAACQALKSAAARARQWSLRRLQPLVASARSLGGDRPPRPRNRVAKRKDDDAERWARGLAFA